MSITDDNNDQRRGDSEETTSNTKKCTSCEQNNDVGNIIGIKTTCAACGKEGNSDDMNICNKCKMVKYCNAACKKKHRKKHKKKCEERVAELYDKKLFREQLEHEECPICMLILPIDPNKCTFKSCCGKRICNGCVYAMKMSEGKDLCAFCRTPPPSSDEEEIKRTKNLMENGNAEAYSSIGSCYDTGECGLPQDYQKANELYLKAGELGCADGYFNLGQAFRQGKGEEVDMKKAKHYYELAAWVDMRQQGIILVVWRVRLAITNGQ